MGLESATNISQLNASNPLGGDARNTADDHIRLIKNVLKLTFAGITGQVTATHTELNKLSGCTSSTAELNLLTGKTANIIAPIPATTVAPFYQLNPPVGWVDSGATIDYMMRVVPANTTGGTPGGSMSPILMNVVPPHQHTLTGVTDAEADHIHLVSANVARPLSGSDALYAALDAGTSGASYTSPAGAHDHAISGMTDSGIGASNWTPRYADFCIGVKS